MNNSVSKGVSNGCGLGDDAKPQRERDFSPPRGNLAEKSGLIYDHFMKPHEIILHRRCVDGTLKN